MHILAHGVRNRAAASDAAAEKDVRERERERSLLRWGARLFQTKIPGPGL